MAQCDREGFQKDTLKLSLIGQVIVTHSTVRMALPKAQRYQKHGSFGKWLAVWLEECGLWQAGDQRSH